MKLYAMTDVGKKRSSNQDAFCCGRLPSGAEYMVLCDGMGGHRGGNLAAEIAVSTFQRFFDEHLNEPLHPKNLKRLLGRVIARVSEYIAATARENEKFSGMGSTVVLAVHVGELICVAHVGDSRAYLYRDGALRRLTKDHSLVQDMLDRGELSPQEETGHPYRNVITRALGYADDSEPEITLSDLRPGDLFLLCTDGLTVTVPQNSLLSLLEKTPSEELAPVLIAHALDSGAPDNVTVGVMVEEREAKV